MVDVFTELRVRWSDAVAPVMLWGRALQPLFAWTAMCVWLLWLAGVATDFGHADGAGNAWPTALIGWWTVLFVVRRAEGRWGIALGGFLAVTGLTVHAWGVRGGDGGGLLKVLLVVAALTTVYDLTLGLRTRQAWSVARAQLARLPLHRRIFIRLTAPFVFVGKMMLGGGMGHYGAGQRGGGVSKIESALFGFFIPVVVVAVIVAAWIAAGWGAGKAIGLGWGEGLAVIVCAMATAKVGRVSVWPLLTSLRLTRTSNASTGTPFAIGSTGNGVASQTLVPTSMPELGDVDGLFAWLEAQGVPTYDERGRGGTFVGKVLDPINGSSEPHEWYQSQYNLLAIGELGSGKTSSLLMPNIVAHKGPVVAVSSALDITEKTAVERALMGRCLFWDPSSDSPAPEYTEEISWNPLIGINTPDDAMSSAQLLIDAMKAQGGGGDQGYQHFADRAAEILAAMFYAAHLDGGRISSVVKWMSAGPEGKGWDEPIGKLTDAEQKILGPDVNPDDAEDLLPERAFLNTLKGVASAMKSGHGANEAHSAIETAKRMLRPLQTERARKHADEATFNPAAWERVEPGLPTIYICTQSGENARRFGPLIALFLNSLVRARRDQGENVPGRAPLKMVFDELAAVPIPSLESILSGDRKYLIKVVAATQSNVQLMEHPLYGAGVLAGFDVKVLFPRSGTSELHEQIESASERVKVWLDSTGASEAGDDIKNRVKNALDPLHGVQGLTASSGSSQIFERALDRADVVGALDPGEVRVIEGLRAITRPVEHVNPESGVVEYTARPVKVKVTALHEEGSIWAAVMAWSEASMALQHREPTSAAALSPEDFVRAVQDVK